MPAPLLHTVHLDPVRAEVAVDCSSLPLAPGDEIRGKLEGPQCRFASTIEIAYPLRQTGQERRVLIPEPSLWSPQTPFLYQGKFEWLRGGQRIAAFRLPHALLKLNLVPAGWRLNGRAFELRTAEVDAPTEEDLLRLRAEGYTALASRMPEPELWDAAARIGFFMVVKRPETLPPGLRQHVLTVVLPK